MKRLELDHIDEQIESLSIIPDFGFKIMPMTADEEFKGWELMLELIKNSHKYERIENYIQAVHYQKNA